MSLTVSVDINNIEPCLGIGHSLSLICQPTSEDIKLYIIIIIITGSTTMGYKVKSHATVGFVLAAGQVSPSTPESQY